MTLQKNVKSRVFWIVKKRKKRILELWCEVRNSGQDYDVNALMNCEYELMVCRTSTTHHSSLNIITDRLSFMFLTTVSRWRSG